MTEPVDKKAIAFFDGQNLYRHSKEAFGYTHPNYDPVKLFNTICTQNSWINCGIRFYTGTPDIIKDPQWRGYWTNRLLALRRSGVLVESRPIRYRTTKITLTDGTVYDHDTAQEKGIDIRIALDIIRTTLTNQLDVVVIFSQDQDLAEVVKEVKDIAHNQKRWIKVVSCFPYGGGATSSRGINGSDWLQIDKTLYDTCLDAKDYRPKSFQSS